MGFHGSGRTMRAVLALAVLLMAVAAMATQFDDSSPQVEEIGGALKELPDGTDIDEYTEQRLKESAGEEEEQDGNVDGDDTTQAVLTGDEMTSECKNSYHSVAQANCRSKTEEAQCVPEAADTMYDWYCDPGAKQMCNNSPINKCRKVVMKGTDLMEPAKCCTWDATATYKCDYDLDAAGNPGGRDCPEPTKKEKLAWMKRKAEARKALEKKKLEQKK